MKGGGTAEPHPQGREGTGTRGCQSDGAGPAPERPPRAADAVRQRLRAKGCGGV